MAAGGSDEEKVRRFVDEMRRDARRSLPELEAKTAELAAPFEQLWQGLARYWSKRP